MITNDSKQCYFCTSNAKNVDYKDAETLKRFLSIRSKIMPRRKTAICSKHQRKLAQAVKRSRQAGITPYVSY